MVINIKDKTLEIKLQGEIDHHTASDIRSRIDSALIKNMPRELILDFNEVTFMDSSGVGLVIGRYKIAQSIKCKIILTNLAVRDKKILMMSGLQDRIEFR